jgi:PHD/YefM family antitoxin component YafN of YafNO toxin-antitoxin module
VTVLKSKYDLLIRNGNERFIVIPEKDYNAMQERLEDDADFRAIEASKKRQSRSPRIPSDQVKRELGIVSRRPKRKA